MYTFLEYSWSSNPQPSASGFARHPCSTKRNIYLTGSLNVACEKINKFSTKKGAEICPRVYSRCDLQSPSLPLPAWYLVHGPLCHLVPKVETPHGFLLQSDYHGPTHCYPNRLQSNNTVLENWRRAAKRFTLTPAARSLSAAAP